MIYERWDNMRCQYRERFFWCRGYYADTAKKDIGVYKKSAER